MNSVSTFLKSKAGQVVVRFAAVFGGFFAFELYTGHNPVGLHDYLVAAAAALPLAIEKFIKPTAPEAVAPVTK